VEKIARGRKIAAKHIESIGRARQTQTHTTLWLRNMGTLTKLPANILELPLAQRAEMALKAAVERVVEEHVRDGRPLYVWRDGKVVEVSAQELREQSTRTP
jgi:hypothetical protein